MSVLGRAVVKGRRVYEAGRVDEPTECGGEDVDSDNPPPGRLRLRRSGGFHGSGRPAPRSRDAAFPDGVGAMSVGSFPQSRGYPDGQPSAAESGFSPVTDRRATCRPSARPGRAGAGPRRQASCAALLPVPPGSGLTGRRPGVAFPLAYGRPPRTPGRGAATDRRATCRPADLPTCRPADPLLGAWPVRWLEVGPFWAGRAREGRLGPVAPGGARSPLSGAARRFDAAGVGAVRSAPSMGPVVPVRRMAGTGSVWAWTAGRPRSVGRAGRPGRAGPGLDLGAVGRSGAAGGWSRPVAATRPCRAQVAVPCPGGRAVPGWPGRAGGGWCPASPGGWSRSVGGLAGRGRGG